MTKLKALAAYSVTVAFLSVWPGCPWGQTFGEAAQTAQCFSTPEWISALRNPQVDEIIVMGDLTVFETDWAAYRTPIVLKRDVIMRGFESLPSAWPIINLTHVQAKLRMDAGFSLTVFHVVLVNWREGPLFQAPGLDIIATGPVPSGANAVNGSAWPHLSFKDMAFINHACLPPKLGTEVTNTTQRPEFIPGNQSITHNTSQAHCSSTSTRLTEWCWPMTLVYEEVVTYGMNFNGTTPEKAGYILWLREARSMCDVILTEECWYSLGSIGCYRSVFPVNDTSLSLKLPHSPPPASSLAPPPDGGAGGKSSGGGGGGSSDVVGPAVGGAVAGVAVVVLLGTVAAVVVARRRRDRAHGGGGGGGVKAIPLEDRGRSFDFLAGLLPHPRSRRVPGDPGSRCIGGKEADPEAATERSSTHAVKEDILSKGGDKRREPLSGSACVSHVVLGLAWGLVTGPSLVPVTPDTPRQPGVNLHVRLASYGGEVQLLPVVIGKGAFGRVVEGLYGGQRVAVKLLNTGLLVGAPAALTPVHVAKGAAPPTLQLLSFESATAAAAASSGGGAGPAHGAVQGDADYRATTSTDPSGFRTSSSCVASDFATADTAFGSPRSAVTGHRQGLAAAAAPPGAGGGGDVDAGNGNGGGGAGASGGGGGAAASASAGPGAGGGGVAGSSAPPEPRDPIERTFLQEVEVLARLRHPNIVRLLGACLKPPELCLVMELMETSLERLMYGRGGMAYQFMSLNKVLHISLQVANALAYLHPTVMHRDLKPANILISGAASDTPTVKLADFGLSRLQTTVLVTAHVEVGTAPYMAPETLNALNCVVTHHVDIYALGVILWEMLAGRRPWAGMNLVQVATAVSLHEQQLPLEELGEERCPRRLRALVRACWDKIPERRPAASEVVKELLLLQERVRHGGANAACSHVGESTGAASLVPVPPLAGIAEAAAPCAAAGMYGEAGAPVPVAAFLGLVRGSGPRAT